MFLEFADWPPAVKALAVVQPFWMGEVPYGLDGDLLTLDVPLDLPELTALEPVFAKLGPKSWRDMGVTCTTPTLTGAEGMVYGLLSCVSNPQARLATAIAQAGEPLRLYLFPGHDFAQISEMRVLVKGGIPRLSSLGRRGIGLDGVTMRQDGILALALHISTMVGDPNISIDFALLPNGGLRLLDINPSQTEDVPAAARIAVRTVAGKAGMF
jgi:hypothetical protein